MTNFNDNDKSKEKHKLTSEEFVHDEGVMEDEDLLKVHAQLMREKAEPSEQTAPIPIFLLFLFGILLFWGGYYLTRYSGGFKVDSFNPEVFGTVAVAVEAKPFDPISRGKKLFMRTCQQCHQADGKGLPGVYPSLAGSAWLLGSDVRPIKILIKGLSGHVTVEGKSFDGNMPPVGDWKDRDIAAVLTYVRQNWENDAESISEELVTKIREEIKERTKPWTESEILHHHPL